MKKERKVKKVESIGKLKVKKVFLNVLSFIVSIAPIVVVFAFKFGEYTKTVKGGVSLAIGGVLAVVLILLKVLNKVPKKVHRVVKYGIVFVLLYLLQGLLKDAVLLCGCAFAGELLDFAIFTIPLKRINEMITTEKTADAVADKVSEKLIAKMNRNLETL